MRKIEKPINAGGTYYGQMFIEFPDEVAFVFNPLYINIKMEDVEGEYKLSKCILQVTDISDGIEDNKEINVSLYNGSTRIYISRLLELFFTDVRCKRSKTIYVTLFVDGSNVWSTTFLAIWGNLAVGDRFAQYGAFKIDRKKPYFERNRIWFRNYPFTVSLFARTNNPEDNSVIARYDNNAYDSNLFIHYPRILKIIQSIEEDGIHGPDETTVIDGNTLAGVVYDKQGKKFYGSTKDYYLYGQWTSGKLVPGPDYFNENGHARIDKVWAYNSKLMRYDAQIQDLVEIPYGRSADTGIYEICPELAFPDAKYYVVITQKEDGKEELKTSRFDETFDYTFWFPGEMSTITKLIIDDSTAGHYLRWIDKFGMFQYFLFIKGKQTLKNKLSNNTIVEDYAVGGMYFANHERNIHIEGNKSYKCCAVSLHQDIYDYVSSILTSPIIDLYMGKTRFGDEMWVPVNIEAANHDYDPQTLLHDLEFTITLPPYNTQSL